MGEPEAAGARRDDAGDRRDAGGGTNRGSVRGEGVRRRRGRLSLLPRRARERPGYPPRADDRWRARPRLPDRARRPPDRNARRPGRALADVDNLSIARVLAEIGDLLEIKNENP